MDRAYRTEAIVTGDSSVQVRDLPFHPGEAVEVIVISAGPARSTSAYAPLRGSVLRYENPIEPVALDDWELRG